MYDIIVNPETKRNVSIHGKTGRTVLRSYVQQAKGKGASLIPKKALPSKGDSPSPKKALPSKGDVWIGELGDVRETKEGQVVAWATVDNTLFGKHVDFIPNAYQPRPG